MKQLLPLVIALSLATPALGDQAQSGAEQMAQDWADTIRDYNAAFGDAVDGELSETQIAAFETMVTPALNVDTQHQSLCAMQGFAAVQRAGIALSSAQMAGEIEAELVPGSMADWLYRLAGPIVIGLGFERSVQAATHECLQHDMINVMFADLPMGSEDMRIQERCFLEDICP